MRNRYSVILSMVAALAIRTLTLAKEEAPPSPCKDDIQRFCKKVKGEPQINQCLMQNGRSISVACKEMLDEMALNQEAVQKMKSFSQTCKTDIETLCPSVTKGGGRHLRCLRTQAEKLTTPCRDLLVQSGVLDAAPAAATEAVKAAAEAPKAAAATGATAPAPVAPAAPEKKK